MHGGVAKDDLKTENVDAVKKGLINMMRMAQSHSNGEIHLQENFLIRRNF